MTAAEAFAYAVEACDQDMAPVVAAALAPLLADVGEIVEDRDRLRRAFWANEAVLDAEVTGPDYDPGEYATAKREWEMARAAVLANEPEDLDGPPF